MESHQSRIDSSQVKIALIGYGKMGKIIEQMALKNGDAIVARISSQNRDWSPSEIQEADVCIDFSHPQCVLQNIHKAIESGKNLVIGTTGWDDHLSQIKTLVNNSFVGALYLPNFSIGAAIFLKIVSEAASLFNSFQDYDVGCTECHHSQKVDSPSGTAKAMAKVLLEKIERKKRIIHQPEEHVDDAIHISSLRCGSMTGTHSVIFDSSFDSITLTHSSKNREGFAKGALLAAHWLQGKKGFFTFENLIDLASHA